MGYFQVRYNSRVVIYDRQVLYNINQCLLLTGGVDLVPSLRFRRARTWQSVSCRTNLHLQIGTTVFLLGLCRRLDLRVDALDRSGVVRVCRSAGIGRRDGRDDHQLRRLHPCVAV